MFLRKTPFGFLRDAPVCRSLDQAIADRRSSEITWANAHRVRDEHDLEVTRIESEAFVAASRKVQS